MTKVVPRSLAPDAPADSDFPSNHNLHHRSGCKINPSDYTCECGLLQHLLDSGAFVRYDASMCRVSHRKKGDKSGGISECLDEFLVALKEMAASIDMTKFNEEEEK